MPCGFVNRGRRGEQEFQEKHLSGTVSIPLDRLGAEIAQLVRDKEHHHRPRRSPREIEASLQAVLPQLVCH